MNLKAVLLERENQSLQELKENLVSKFIRLGLPLNEILNDTAEEHVYAALISLAKYHSEEFISKNADSLMSGVRAFVATQQLVASSDFRAWLQSGQSMLGKPGANGIKHGRFEIYYELKDPFIYSPGMDVSFYGVENDFFNGFQRISDQHIAKFDKLFYTTTLKPMDGIIRSQKLPLVLSYGYNPYKEINPILLNEVPYDQLPQELLTRVIMGFGYQP